MSNETCSTATSGVFSAKESDCSNSTEQSMVNTKLDNIQPSRDPIIGLPVGERTLETLANKHFQKNDVTGLSYVSRLPPPKPSRYDFQKSSQDLPYLRANSDGDQSSNNTPQNSRIMWNKKEAASFMNKSKDSKLLV
jgi:hypothetical protein